MSLTNAHDPGLEHERLLVVIATIVINVIAVSLLTLAPWFVFVLLRDCISGDGSVD